MRCFKVESKWLLAFHVLRQEDASPMTQKQQLSTDQNLFFNA